MVNHRYFLQRRELYLDKSLYKELCNMEVSVFDLEKERINLISSGHPKPSFNVAAAILIDKKKRGDRNV